MDRSDVLIVGAGPAGASCAWRLMQARLRVTLVDKQAFPRDKVCAGWVTPQVAAALQLDLIDYAEGRTLQPIRGFRTGLIGGQMRETRFIGTVSYGIRRCEFDDYLAQRSGARLRLAEPVQDLYYRQGEWTLNGCYRAPLLIGAGGHFCPVARHLGARPGASELSVTAKELEFPLSPEQRKNCPIATDTPELYFCGDLKGYGWALRKGDYLNIGLGREDNRQLGRHLEGFCAELQRQGRIPDELPGRFHGHAYLLYHHSPRPLYDNGVLLIGDAAGLAYPESGEGIRPAVESGLIAAECILAANGDYSRRSLAPYDERLTQRFGPRGRPPPPSWLISLRRTVGKRILANPWATRRLLIERWFLHGQQKAMQPSTPRPG